MILFETNYKQKTHSLYYTKNYEFYIFCKLELNLTVYNLVYFYFQILFIIYIIIYKNFTNWFFYMCFHYIWIVT